MTIYSEQRDVIDHMHQQEIASGFRDYDHMHPTPVGWRSEREFAEHQETNTRNGSGSLVHLLRNCLPLLK
ncbi:hypothetical protein [Roseibium sp.]|uniref:hypothetical protein n=1 Tax=Roseibium sp. TaxID=1936156 RepID=UPI003D0EE72B